MVDAPDRIWSIGAESPYRINCSTLDHSGEPGCTEYLRADIAASQLAEAKRQFELADKSDMSARDLLNDVEAERDRLAAELEAERWKAHAASLSHDEETQRLAADNARLREALEQIAAIMPVSNCDSGSMARSRMKDIARNAIRAMGEKK